MIKLDIPKSWKWEKLDDALDFVIGGDWGKDENFEDTNYGLAYCIRGSEIKNWQEEKGKTASLRKIKLSNIEKRKLVEGDILVEISGGGPEQPVGRTVLIDKTVLSYKPEIPKICTNFLRLIRPKNYVDGKFLNLYLKLFYYSGEIVKYQGGSNNLRNLKFPDFIKINFPLPPKPIQQAIVSKIEELFSELDKGIENLRLAQQQLKTYRQAVLKWAFEGKLTDEWRIKQKYLISGEELIKQINKEKERIANHNKKKIKSLSKIDKEELEELYVIPNEWKWARNEEYLFEVKDGTHDTPKYLEKGIPFVTQKNIREDGLDFKNMQFISEADHNKFYLRSNVAKGDVIISMIGHNRGMTAIVDTDKIFSIKNVGLFKFLAHLQSNKFSFYYYQSRVGLNIVLRKSKGGAQPFIGLTELRNWPVVVCSFEEQIQIVQEIESRLSVANKMEESIIQSLQQAEALRQSILKKAFEGRLI